jgi:uncharacterized protein YceH (UPF0502 family)
MIRLNRIDAFKVMQWMQTNREELESKTVSEGVRIANEAGFRISENIYSNMRQDLSWKNNQQKADQDIILRLAKLETQVAELQKLIFSQPWNNPRLL